MGDETRCQPVGALSAEPALAIRSRRRPSARAFAIFRRMVVEQAAAADVMKEFGITRQRVYFLVRRVTKWSKEHEGVGDVLALKVQDTVRLEGLYQEVYQQWRRSCQDAKSHSIVTIEGNATSYEGSIVRLPDKKTTRLHVKNQNGDAQLAKLLKEILADKRAIWGGDAPKRTETEENHHVTIEVTHDAGWYGNKAHALAAARAIAAPASGAVQPGEIQSGGMWAPVGQDGAGADGSD